MKRFFRSAAFPILIVLVLAFFASQVINPGEPEEIPTFNEFTERVDTDPDSIETVTFEQKENKLKYTLQDGTEYETGYLAEQEDTLINTLQREEIETNIDPIKGGGILMGTRARDVDHAATLEKDFSQYGASNVRR